MKKNAFTLVLGILLTLNAFSSNIISNGDFELGTVLASSYWATTTTSPGAQTVSIDNTSQISGVNSIKANVTTTAGPSYTTRLGIYQFMTLPKAATYTVTFKAKSTANCTMLASLAQSYSGYSALFTSTPFNVTNTLQTFTCDITIADLTISTGLCKFSISYGAAIAGTNIYIDDVTVIEKTALTDRNLCNGDFEKTMSNTIYNTSNYTYNGMTSGTPDATQNQMYYGWTLDKYTTRTADVSASIDTSSPISGAKSILLSSVGTATSNAADVMFCWVFAGQKDQLYAISFKAKASTACTMAVDLSAVAYVDATSSLLTAQTCNLTTSVQSFTFATTKKFVQSADGRAVLRFQLGKLPNGVSVSLDDVVLSVKETPVISWSQNLSTVKTTDNSVSLTASSAYNSLVLPAANDISYSSDNTAVVTVNGNTMTVVGAGTANVTASQLSNSFYYDATPVVVPVTVTDDVHTLSKDATADAPFLQVKDRLIIHEEGELQVLSIIGQSVRSEKVHAGSKIELNSGVYLVHFFSKKNNLVKKIII